MDYFLVDQDIYRLSKSELFRIASSYRINLPYHEDEITSADLRTKLALVKKLLQTSERDPDLKVALEKLYSNNELSESEKSKYPLLEQYQNILGNFYEIPFPNKITDGASNSHEIDSYENKIVIEHEKLLGRRKEFLSPQSIPKEDTVLNKSIQDRSLPSPPFQQSKNNLATQKSQQQVSNMENIPLIKAGTFGALGSENVEEFITRYNTASKCNRWSESTKIDLFQTHLTSTPYKWFTMYKLENPNLKWNDLENDFLKTFTPIAQIEDLQSILDNRLQCPSETPLQFVYEITHLCRRIDPYMSDDKIIQYVLQGIDPEFCSQLLALQNKSLNQLKDNIYEIEKKSLLKNKNLQKHSGTHFSTKITPSTSNNFKTLRFDDETLNTTKVLSNKVQQLEETIAALAVNTTNRESRRDYSNDYTDRSQRRSYSKSPSTSLDRQQDRKFYRSPSSSRNFFGNSKSASRDLSRGPKKYCHICKLENHSTDNCSFNAKNKNNSNRVKPQNKMWCAFCNVATHTYDRCFKRPKNNHQPQHAQHFQPQFYGYQNYPPYQPPPPFGAQKSYQQLNFGNAGNHQNQTFNSAMDLYPQPYRNQPYNQATPFGGPKNVK